MAADNAIERWSTITSPESTHSRTMSTLRAGPEFPDRRRRQPGLGYEQGSDCRHPRRSLTLMKRDSTLSPAPYRSN